MNPYVSWEHDHDSNLICTLIDQTYIVPLKSLLGISISFQSELKRRLEVGGTDIVYNVNRRSGFIISLRQMPQ